MGKSNGKGIASRLRQMSYPVADWWLGRFLVRCAQKILAWSDASAWSRTRTVYHRGLPMPPLQLRNHMCGPAFLLNDFYLQSAVVEATRLPARLGYTKDSLVVDVGCGLGRLATGMLSEFGDEVHYLGIEPNKDFYRWCEEHIQTKHPNYQFRHLDVVSELYNPSGTVDGEALRLPVDSDTADIVYVWGVFTNIISEHVEIYVSEFARIANKDGRIFLTAFVEKDVPQVSLNPSDYVPFDYIVPLHVVRYNVDWLFSLFSQNGLAIEDFRYHGGMFPKQSEITLTKLVQP